jgi:hypothetical protein
LFKSVNLNKVKKGHRQVLQKRACH